MTRYSTGAIVLHWLIAAALAFELALGFFMPDGMGGFAQIQLHKSMGISILVLTVLRLGWRLLRPRPQPLESGWAHHAAHAVHWAFYGFMLLGPLTGWALASTAPVKVPTILFGTVPLPHLPLPGSIHETTEGIHEALALIGIALIVLHIAGALRHEILLRDRLLERMAPGGSRPIALLFAAGVAAAALAGFAVATSGPAPAAAEAKGAPAEAAPVPGASSEAAASEAPGDAASEAAAEAPGPPPVWTIAPGGRLSFSVGNGDAGTISGSFAKWGGAIAFDPDRPETADIRIEVDLASASVGDPTQDAMLVGDEFLATGRYATAVFRARSARQTGEGRYTASGTLDLHGATRPLAISFRLTGTGLKRHAQGTASVPRNAFGIGSGPAAETLAGNVSVSFAFDATGKVPAR